jgi:hypothetical protein
MGANIGGGLTLDERCGDRILLAEAPGMTFDEKADAQSEHEPV